MASTHISAGQLASPIRPINITRDMQAVMRLLNRVFSPTLDQEGRNALNSMSNQPSLVHRIQQFGNKLAPGFIWEEKGSIVGNVSIIPTNEVGRIILANVAVHEKFRRRGIAQALMEATLNHLGERHVNTVMLQVDVDNSGAQRLYQNLGFHTVGSTTYWTASPGSWREVATSADFDVRPLRSFEHDKAFELDRKSYMVDLNWPDPITEKTYRGSFWRSLDNFLNGKTEEHWVIDDEAGNLLALGSIWGDWGRPYRITLRALPDQRDQLMRPLFAKISRRLSYMRRRHATVEHLYEDELTGHLLKVANFHPKRHLTTMRLDL
jgi:predicted N-acetyltransferase YhbS